MKCISTCRNLFNAIFEKKFKTVFFITLFLAGVFLASSSMAQEEDDEENTFEESELFIELNATDLDLGIQAFVDGGPYKKLKIIDPDGKPLLVLNNTGSLADQGLTELFFESSEPSFDELPPDVFFARFPEGEYDFEGKKTDNQIIEGDADFTHLLAAPPGGIEVNDMPASQQLPEPDVDCEGPAEDLTQINFGDPVFIEWLQVSQAITDYDLDGDSPFIIGDSEDLEVTGYKVIVDLEELNENIELLRYSVDIPSNENLGIPLEVQISPEYMQLVSLSEEDLVFVKFEIQTVEDSGNITSVESCFAIVNE